MSAENSENAMAAYIKKELDTRKAEEISELLLDNCKSKEIVGLEGQKWSRLNHISFIGCDLESISGLPKLPEVRVLDLSENKLEDVSHLVESVPALYHLNLCGNNLKTIDQLKPLGKLSNLQALDIFDCPLTETEGYRQEVFAAIPSLKYLDGFDVNDEEAEDLGAGGEDGAEDGLAEDLEDDEEEDSEEVGLDYLNSSKALNDDSSTDFEVNGKANGKPAQKRKLEDQGDAEVPEKTSKEA